MAIIPVLLLLRSLPASDSSPAYKHPGIMVSIQMLDAMRADVQAKREPRYSAYLATLNTPTGIGRYAGHGYLHARTHARTHAG